MYFLINNTVPLSSCLCSFHTVKPYGIFEIIFHMRHMIYYVTVSVDIFAQEVYSMARVGRWFKLTEMSFYSVQHTTVVIPHSASGLGSLYLHMDFTNWFPISHWLTSE